MNEREKQVQQIIGDTSMPAGARADRFDQLIAGLRNRGEHGEADSLSRSFGSAVASLRSAAYGDHVRALQNAGADLHAQAAVLRERQQKAKAPAPTPPAVASLQDEALDRWRSLQQTNPMAAARYLLDNQAAIVAAQERLRAGK